MAVILQMC